MPLTRHSVEGYENVQALLAKLKGRVFILFTGSKDSTGRSWCPDCVRADPVVEKVVTSPAIQALDANFVICSVGGRDFWKDPKCPFRTDAKFKLTCVPTLALYGSKVQRLLDNQVANENLVKDLLNGDDE